MLQMRWKRGTLRGPERKNPLWVCLVLVCAVASVSMGKEASSDHLDRHQIAVGYSLLYQEAVGIPKLGWLLAFKSKSAEMNSVTSSLIDYYKDLSSRMEKLVKQYPAIELRAKTMSTIEENTRKSMGVDQAKGFAPLIGNTGSSFEREALITFRSALDEQRHLVGVMLDNESNPALREFLQSTKAALEDHYKQVDALLEKQYFSH